MLSYSVDVKRSSIERDERRLIIVSVNFKNRRKSRALHLSTSPIMKLEGGDDLEDDFVPDDLVALSEDEGEGAPVQNSCEFVAGELCEDEEDSTDLITQVAKKRKRREREKEKKAKVCP